MSPSMHLNLRQRASLIYRVLNVIDCLAVVGYLYLLTGWYKVPWSPYYTRLVWITVGLCFISFQWFQLYRSWRGWKYYLEFLVIAQAWGTVVGLLLFYFFFFKISEAYSRFVFLVWSLSTPFLIFAIHFLVRRILHAFRSRGKNIRHAVVVGAGDLGRRLMHEVENIPWAGIRIVGFFDDKIDEMDASRTGAPLLGRTSDVRAFLQGNDIDYVYIALPMRAERKIFSLLRECRDLGARIFLIPDLYIYGLHHAEIQSLGDLLILSFNPDTTWKRAFDIVFSLAVLTALSPLLLCIALLIKLEDGGPVFYRQRRIAEAGREFFCIKFRTMVPDAENMLEDILDADPARREEWERSFKLKNDPRITRIGRILRRTSLDELPQFINVLKGEMSVVGPRPIVEREKEKFYKEMGGDSAGRYCSMKPGITGPWQVMLRSDTDDYRRRVELDNWYVLNYSPWLDFKIILKTVLCMFSGKGAY